MTDEEGSIPRDSFEFEMQRIWQSVLQQPYSINLKHNFFEIGGHSLTLIQLQAKIKKQFGKEIPLTDMLQNATIEEMAALIRKGVNFTDQPPIIALKENKGKTPIYLIHQVGGYCFRYRHLTRILGNECSVYGVQISNPFGDFSSIKEMAEHYINEIKKIQPKGPYFLVGHSLGGSIAFEMAIQLQKSGDKVGSIALLDTFLTPFSDAVNEIDEAELILEYVKDRIQLSENQIQEMNKLYGDEKVKFILDIGKTANYYRVDMDVIQLKRVLSVYVKHLTAWKLYQKPNDQYHGEFLFFRSQREKDNSSMGWNEIVSKPMEIYSLDALHHELVEEPYVQMVATKIMEKISEVLNEK
ncbi:thioesterase domain-containing protein [Bacillus cereus]